MNWLEVFGRWRVIQLHESSAELRVVVHVETDLLRLPEQLVRVVAKDLVKLEPDQSLLVVFQLLFADCVVQQKRH